MTAPAPLLTEQILGQLQTQSPSWLVCFFQKSPEWVPAVTHRGQTTLMIAAGRHQASVVEALLTMGADIAAREFSGNTALVEALRDPPQDPARRDRRVLELLVLAGADLNDDDDGHITPVMMCCQSNKLDLLRWLVELGADVNHVVPGDEMSALQYASLHGIPEAVAELLALGASQDDVVGWVEEEVAADPSAGDDLRHNREACLVLLKAHALCIATPPTQVLRPGPRL